MCDISCMTQIGNGCEKAFHVNFLREYIIIDNNSHHIFPFISLRVALEDFLILFKHIPWGGTTNSTRQWISSMPALPFVSPDPCEMIVDRIITFTDRDLFACLCVFKLACNDKWLLNEAANYCLFAFLVHVPHQILSFSMSDSILSLHWRIYRDTAALTDLYLRSSRRAARGNQISRSAFCNECWVLLDFWSPFREYIILWISDGKEMDKN